MHNRKLLVLYLLLSCIFDLYAMSDPFAEFKNHIVGKTGSEVHAYITPIIKDRLDTQTVALQDHMIKHGHFGYKPSISKSNTSVVWSTFFIKSDNSLFLTDSEQKDCIRKIWNSKLLEYSCDIPGCSNGVSKRYRSRYKRRLF